MQSRISKTFHVSLLSAAMLSTTGCAVTSDPSQIGESIMTAGRVTADASVRAYEGTKRILGFDRNDPQLDEVDMALMNKEEAWSIEQENSGAVVRPVQTASRLELQPLDGLEQPPEGAPAIATMPAVDPNAIPVATIDYNHIVGPNETMWTIAKLTTGNANNWRILAEINQLDLNSPMQIGQEILVPADLVRPEIVASLVTQQPIVNEGVINEELMTADATPVLELAPENNELSIRPIAKAELESDPLNPDQVLPATEEIVADAGALTDSASDIKLDSADDLTLAAAAPIEETAPAIDPSIDALPLTADAGETLWDMSKRTTGDATNWKAIAEHNGFTEKDIGRIRYGQTIYVPEALAKTDFGGLNEVVAKAALPKTDASADADATNDLVAAATTDATDLVTEEAVDSSAALIASASNLMDETQDIKIVEATFNSEEAIDPALKATPGNVDGDVIMVSGTYYPKAVYNEADFSSSLLMRVSPGTELTVTRAMGPWYEVQTEFGVGFMHSRDIK